MPRHGRCVSMTACCCAGGDTHAAATSFCATEPSAARCVPTMDGDRPRLHRLRSSRRRRLAASLDAGTRSRDSLSASDRPHDWRIARYARAIGQAAGQSSPASDPGVTDQCWVAAHDLPTLSQLARPVALARPLAVGGLHDFQDVRCLRNRPGRHLMRRAAGSWSRRRPWPDATPPVAYRVPMLRPTSRDCPACRIRSSERHPVNLAAATQNHQQIPPATSPIPTVSRPLGRSPKA